MMDNSDAEWFHKQGFVSSSRKVQSGSTVHFHANFTTVEDEKPIMMLLHGYPQTSFMWRYAANYLPKDTPLFIPDLPGYGRSTPATRHDKRVIGESVVEALWLYLGADDTAERPGIILVGHDRGARVAHRLAVDLNGHTVPYQLATHNHFEIAGLVIMDILPTSEQWKIIASASKNSARSFHWSLLANVELATSMIKAYGGGKWCGDMIKRWSGPNEEGQRSLRDGNALEIYAKYFEQKDVIRATSEDYRAGAEEDVLMQEKDQAKNMKITVPTLVLYSSDFAGNRYGADMGRVWGEWVADGVEVKTEEIANSGHFIAEEQPAETYDHVATFYEDVQTLEVLRRRY